MSHSENNENSDYSGKIRSFSSLNDRESDFLVQTFELNYRTDEKPSFSVNAFRKVLSLFLSTNEKLKSEEKPKPEEKPQSEKRRKSLTDHFKDEYKALKIEREVLKKENAIISTTEKPENSKFSISYSSHKNRKDKPSKAPSTARTTESEDYYDKEDEPQVTEAKSRFREKCEIRKKCYIKGK
jgi:hypothetical protein